MPTEDLFDIRWFDIVSSTNTGMAEDRSGLGEWCVYAAHQQTAGRGQRGNAWHSAKDENLTFSVLLRPESLSAGQQFAISEAVALGISDYLATHDVTALIKWPNDIYAGNRKICGVLIENFLSADKLAECVVGIGLNLNQRAFDPSVPNPTSLSLLKDPEGSGSISYDIDMELRLLLKHIRNRYSEMMQSRESAHNAYLDRLYLRGEWHGFLDCRDDASANLIPTTQAAGSHITGRIVGVTPEGLLKVELPEGNVETFAFKELRYIM